MKFNTLKETMKYVANLINREGLEYTFYGYSNFDEIKDEKFHKLRKDFLQSMENLTDYINSFN